MKELLTIVAMFAFVILFATVINSCRPVEYVEVVPSAPVPAEYLFWHANS